MLSNLFQSATAVGFASKVDPIGNESVSTGITGALARPSVRNTINLKPLDAVTVSRFALIAGEDTRAPSISCVSFRSYHLLGKATATGSVPVIVLSAFGQGPRPLNPAQSCSRECAKARTLS